jgi:hypothetical protein
MKEHIAIFIKAVQEADSLPSAVRQGVQSIDYVASSTFDQSYLEFIDEQIGQEARGAEWTALLKARRNALTPYRDVPTLVGFIPAEGTLWSIRVDPVKGKVIHGEPLSPS